MIKTNKTRMEDYLEAKQWPFQINKNDLQLCRVDSLLSEDSQYKISLFVGVEAGRNDQIISRREFEPAGHFPQVSETHRIL